MSNLFRPSGEFDKAQEPKVSPTEAGSPAVASDTHALIRLAQWLRAARALTRRTLSRLLEPLGMSEDDLAALYCCQTDSAAADNQGRLAESLGLSAGKTSQLLESLRARGWLAAERGRRDRRRQLWSVTRAGRNQLEAAAAVLAPLASDPAFRDMLAARDTASAALARLLELLAAFDNGAGSPRSSNRDWREAG